MGLFGSSKPSVSAQTYKDAYGVVGDAYEAYGENRRLITDQHTDEMANARARMGASGVGFEGSAWQNISGNLTDKRDDALAILSEEEDIFAGGTAMSLVRQDFAAMGVSARRPDKGEGGGDYGSGRQRTTYTYTGKSAATGESFLTEEQQKMVRTKGSAGLVYMYGAEFKPTFEEYLKFRFGTDEEKAAFSDSMTARIEASNKKYASARAVANRVQTNKTDFYRDRP